MSKGKDEKDNEKDVRRIKQVYVNEDGDERETVVSTRHKDPAEEDDKRSEADQESFATPAEAVYGNEHTGSSGRSVVRGIAIAVAMLFSLALAMSVGVGLALWDSNRTIEELRAIVLGQEVAAATPQKPDNTEDAPQQAADTQSDAGHDTVADAGDDSDTKAGPEAEEEAEDTKTAQEADEDKAGDTDTQEEAEEDMDAEAEWDEPSGYGSTIISDEEGSENVEKAGSDDEIVTEEEEEETDNTDPTQDYPLPFTTVDESYFTDALFIGDSRLQGFGFWSGLPATYYCATGFQLYKYDTAKIVQTENGKVPIFEALPYDAFTKIYIKVGLNELGYGTEENFEKYYAALIAQLREYEPRAIIYVHGLLPVTAEKSASDKAHNNPNIIVRNEALKKFAEKEKAYYLDAGPVLSDADGNLRPEMTTDGIHLSAQYMKIWREYLCEHAVVIE